MAKRNRGFADTNTIMSSNNTTRIETGDLLIHKNADGDLEFVDQDSGKRIAIGAGGFSTEEAHAELSTHSTEISGDHTIEAGESSLIGGSLTGTGSISGDGRLTIIDDGVHGLHSPLGVDVDANGHAINNAGSVGTDELNTNRVWDTSGRYHGELTGTDDAQVVIDAITDRTAGSSLIVPDPGFKLDWEQQVDFPVENRFGIQTVGNPSIRPASGFTGSYAFYKPSGVGYDMYLGPCQITDNDGVLTEALRLEDIRGAMIDRVKTFNCPGIRIISEDIYANQNVLNQCEVSIPAGHYSPRNEGSGIILDEGSQGNTTDQNWIFAPMYNASRDHTGAVGYIDRGKHNNWLYTRAEFCHTIHQMEGGYNYYVSEGGWDRPDEYSVREMGGTSGHPPGGFIQNVYGSNYERIRILNPNTTVTTSGDVDSGARPRLPVVDILEDVKKTTSARSLASLGLQDDSNGGSVSIGPTWYYKPWLSWSTGATSGYTAVLSTGSNSLSATAMPKAAYSWVPRSTGDDADVIARTGLYGDSGNRWELVFDPNNKATANWYLEVAQGGTLLDSIDTGVAPHGENDLSFSVANLESGTLFCASVDYNDFDISGDLTGFNAQMEWRWYLETLAADSKDWRLRDDRGMRFYKF